MRDFVLEWTANQQSTQRRTAASNNSAKSNLLTLYNHLSGKYVVGSIALSLYSLDGPSS